MVNIFINGDQVQGEQHWRALIKLISIKLGLFWRQTQIVNICLNHLFPHLLLDQSSDLLHQLVRVHGCSWWRHWWWWGGGEDGQHHAEVSVDIMIVLQEPAHSLAPLLTVVVEVEEDGLRGSLHVAEKSCINCDKYCEEKRDEDLSDHFLYFNDCLLIIILLFADTRAEVRSELLWTRAWIAIYTAADNWWTCNIEPRHVKLELNFVVRYAKI